MARRWLAAARWVAGILALTALFVRISLSARVMSDGASNALEAWDLLHGHMLLHGWQVSDVNYFFLEIPLLAVAETLFGLGAFAMHVASSLTCVLIVVVAVAAAVTGSHGTARAVRCAVVLAVLAAPLFAGVVFLVLEEPDHIGTSVIIIGSFLLIDRLPGRRFTALLLVVLSAGQFDDITVRYVAVPAIVAVCAHRALAARSFRSPDALAAYTALASVPLSALFGWLWVRSGGFTTAAPWGKRSPAGQWLHHVPTTWLNIRILYGAGSISGIVPGWKDYFGLACLCVAIFGLARVAWRWRRASRAEQLIAAAVVFNVGTFVVSGFVTDDNPHELALLLPCGAVLAARALVPARITGMVAAYASVTVAVLAAALPLAYAAARPNFQTQQAPLAAFLEAHHLTRGLGSYNEAATVTLLTHGRIQIRPLHRGYSTAGPSDFETNSQWYSPSQHEAFFAVTDPTRGFTVHMLIHTFGRPTSTYQVDNWTIMVYKTNLYRTLANNSRRAAMRRSAGQLLGHHDT